MRKRPQAIPRRIAVVRRFAERVGDFGHPLVVVVLVTRSLGHIRAGAGMIFVRAPIQSAIGVVMALGESAVLVCNLGDQSTLIVVVPSSV